MRLHVGSRLGGRVGHLVHDMEAARHVPYAPLRALCGVSVDFLGLRSLRRLRQDVGCSVCLQAHGLREKGVQQVVVELYQAAGCRVSVLSQPRATMQTEGLPDLYVQLPGVQGRYSGLRWWHETKPVDGLLSAVQVAWAADERAAGGMVVVGGWLEAARALDVLGLATWNDGAATFVLQPQAPVLARWAGHLPDMDWPWPEARPPVQAAAAIQQDGQDRVGRRPGRRGHARRPKWLRGG